MLSCDRSAGTGFTSTRDSDELAMTVNANKIPLATASPAAVRRQLGLNTSACTITLGLNTAVAFGNWFAA
jgi:hypothetical protein